MAHRTINNTNDLEKLAHLLGRLPMPFTVEWVKGRDRTRDQNALQWLWAVEAATQLGDRPADEMQRDWKLRHGVPILREESAEFRSIYDKAIRPLPYELKVQAMRFIPVTSEMKVPQMVRYLDAIWRECAEQGLQLTEPDPELSKYQARYRERNAA